MRIFVAGATGVIGRAVVTRLLADGHLVTGLARSVRAAEQLESAGATAARAELFDPAGLERVVAGHDAVINLATSIPGGSRATKPDAWEDNNRVRTEGSQNLVAAALATGASVYVQESVAFLYPDHGDDWVERSSSLAPSIWTAPVEAAEANAMGFADPTNGRRGVVLRFGGFYSSESEHTRLLYRAACHGFSLDLGRHDAYFPVIHVDDAAAAVVAALNAPSGRYDIVDDTPMTRREQAAVWSRVLGRPVRRLPLWLSRFAGVAGPALQRSMRVSNRSFRDATGWRPSAPSIADSLPTIVNQLGGPPKRLPALIRTGLWALVAVGMSTSLLPLLLP